jgi:hypothetical protein
MLFGIAVAFFAAPAQPLLAQAWQVGFSAAPTYTNVTGDFVARSDWAWGLLIGGQIEYLAHRNFSAELGANFLQKGTELGQTTQGDFGSLRLRYLELPLLLTLKLPLSRDWSFRAFGGGTLGINFSCQVKGISNVWDSCVDATAVGDAETLEWSVPFGGGLGYTTPFADSSLILDVRYVLGMSNIFKDVDLKTRTWEFLARWQFAI